MNFLKFFGYFLEIKCDDAGIINYYLLFIIIIPKASKSILIVKGLEHLPKARSVFKDTGVLITTEGDRHLGAVLGSESLKHEFVKRKVCSWVKDIEELAIVAKEEPQIAYSAFTKGLSSRWCYIQRTIEGIKSNQIKSIIMTIYIISAGPISYPTSFIEK